MEHYTKPALTCSQQIDLLISRGLTVADQADAGRFLSQVNYYRLSAYCLPFEVSRHQFKQGATFEKIRALYEFDRCLRFLIDEALEVIEIYFRTLIAYHLSHAYGAFAHEDAKLFKPRFDHTTWINKVHDEAERSTRSTRSKETFVDHYKNKYDNFPCLPIWMAVETMSFGALSQLYHKGMFANDQIAIARNMGLHNSVLYSWLHTFTYVRNICAHHGRLWNRELAIAMVLPNDGKWQGVKPRRISVVLFALERVLSRLPSGAAIANAWHEEILRHLGNPVDVDGFYESMGLTKDYANHQLWTFGK